MSVSKPPPDPPNKLLASVVGGTVVVFNWTGGELAILQNPVNKENALFVIGQVFGFIDPDFNDNFVSGELLEKDEIKTKINNKLNADKDTIINFITTQKNTYTKKNALSAFTGSLINPFTI